MVTPSDSTETRSNTPEAPSDSSLGDHWVEINLRSNTPPPSPRAQSTQRFVVDYPNRFARCRSHCFQWISMPNRKLNIAVAVAGYLLGSGLLLTACLFENPWEFYFIIFLVFTFVWGIFSLFLIRENCLRVPHGRPSA